MLKVLDSVKSVCRSADLFQKFDKDQFSSSLTCKPTGNLSFCKFTITRSHFINIFSLCCLSLFALYLPLETSLSQPWVLVYPFVVLCSPRQCYCHGCLVKEPNQVWMVMCFINFLEFECCLYIYLNVMVDWIVHVLHLPLFSLCGSGWGLKYVYAFC